MKGGPHFDAKTRSQRQRVAAEWLSASVSVSVSAAGLTDAGVEDV